MKILSTHRQKTMIDEIRVANGAVRCDQIRHRTDGAPMHEIVHKNSMHA